MSAAKSALIVGGGIAGMSCALSLARHGVKVEIVERDPDWRVYGAGISIIAPTLRAFQTLGVLDDVRREGFCSGGVRVYSPGGQVIVDAPPPPGDLPSGAGIMRPALHRILQAHVHEAGVKVALGLTVDRLDPDLGQATLSDSSTREVDVIVGADGLFSQLRRQVLPDAPRPHFTGQGCWRVVAPRPATVDRVEIYLGAETKAGLNPVSQDEMYLFVLEHVPDNAWIEPKDYAERLKRLLEPYGGHLPAVRDSITEASSIVYRPLECVLVPKPWSRGRVVLIGDAVHGTTPHLASGAGMAVEDGIVLAEELARAADVASALQAFTDRRFERCRTVVESSLKLGEIEMTRGDVREHQRITRLAEEAMAAAI